MRLDFFCADIFNISTDFSKPNHALMVDQAEMFLLSGLTWERWAMLSEESREAFSEAGRKIRDDFGLTIAKYIVGALDESEHEREHAPDHA